MDRENLVTVVVLSYNRRHYLKQALESALDQTYRNFEVLVVDDASPDGSGDLASQYAARYPDQVTAICKERRGGAVDSVNRIVFPHCKQKSGFVAFHPDDDLWAPEKLERQMECFAGDPELGMVYTDAVIIDADGRATGQRFSELYGRWDGRNLTRRLLLRPNFICGASVAVTREALSSFGYFIPPPIRFLDDHFMWTAISSQFRVHYLDEPLTYYRVSPGNVSSKYTRAMYREDYQVRSLLYDSFPSVRQFVSAEEWRGFRRRFALDRARENLQAGRIWHFAWFGAKALQEQRDVRTVAALGIAARERERELRAAMAEKDRAIDWLKQQVREKDRAIDWLQEQVREKDHTMQALSELLTEKDSAV